MKYRPILFSTDMVKAILEGRKSQTRRIVNPQPTIYKDVATWKKHISTAPAHWSEAEHINTFLSYKCPIGAVGDIIWVREEHYAWGWWENAEGKITKTGKQKRKFLTQSPTILFPDTFGINVLVERTGAGWHKRLARFMTKSACRIFLRIDDVRVERLQDISEGDAIAEGVQRNCEGKVQDCVACRQKGKCQSIEEWFHYTRDFEDFPAYSAVESYFSLWEKINGKESLDSNPWVWCLKFTRIDKPENF